MTNRGYPRTHGRGLNRGFVIGGHNLGLGRGKARGTSSAVGMPRIHAWITVENRGHGRSGTTQWNRGPRRGNYAVPRVPRLCPQPWKSVISDFFPKSSAMFLRKATSRSTII